MADDKTKRGAADRGRVAGEQEYEVDHFAKKHGISTDQARELIRKHGNNREELTRRQGISGRDRLPRVILAVPLKREPMESLPVEDVPTGGDWLFEPKWDGFRAITFGTARLFACSREIRRRLIATFPNS